MTKGIEPHAKYGVILMKDMLRDYCTEYEIKEIIEIIY